MSGATGRKVGGWLLLAGLVVTSCVRAGFDPSGDGATAGDATMPWPGVRSVQVGPFSVSSTGFVPVPGATLTIPASTDRWLLLLSALLSSTNSGAPTGGARFLIDGKERGGGEVLAGQGTFGPWQQLCLMPASATEQIVRVELGDSRGTSTIRDLAIIAFPLPTRADVHYAEHDATQSVPNADADYLELQVDPVRAGRYLVLASLNASEAPGAGSISVWLAQGTDMWPTATTLKVGRQYWQSLFLARAVDLNAPSSLTIMASGDETVGSSIRYARILAFRTDAFADYAMAQDLTETSSSNATLRLTSTLPAGSTSSPDDHLTIQSLLLWTDETAPQIPRQVRFETDGQPALDYLCEQPPNVRAMHGRFVLSQGAAAARSRFAAPQGGVVRAAESTIHRLRLTPAP